MPAAIDLQHFPQQSLSMRRCDEVYQENIYQVSGGKLLLRFHPTCDATC